jgi:tRNA nucleotidyltransferase (CCA-adding enzyme)
MVRIYQVGGSVRDNLLGLRSKDLDYAVEASSYDEMREHIIMHGRIYLETPEYFTIRAQMPTLGDADFVLCRKDGTYSDARRPDFVELGTIFDDLARRDFTINAMAINRDTEEFLDPHNGQEDLVSRVIRCVGDPEKRFKEDALRMLRALRFSVTKGFTIHKSVQEALQNPELIYLLENYISSERKKDELLKMFRYDSFQSMLLLAHKYDGIGRALLDCKVLWLEPTLQGR